MTISVKVDRWHPQGLILVILWDGKDCLPDSGCCTFNTPPVFRVQLLATTNDDLEVRICSGATSLGGLNTENTPITLMEIYVK